MTIPLLITTLALSAASGASISLSSSGTVINTSLTVRDQRLLFRVCGRMEADQQERCRERQLRRMGYTYSKASPTSAFAVYDRLDLGKNHLRPALQARRLQENADRVAATRRTFRQAPTQTVSDLHPDYMTYIREERLRCMQDVPHGRPRSLCFDELADYTTKVMRSEREKGYVVPPTAE